VKIVHGENDYVCVPLQGSGTFAVEAALGTLVPRQGCVLVPNNGAYCARLIRILQRMGIAYVELALREDEPVSAAAIEDAFNRNSRITTSRKSIWKRAPACSIRSTISPQCVSDTARA
jgi:Serine-pyruvate aminotransferase/archaeal aspartate aminotransferase